MGRRPGNRTAGLIRAERLVNLWGKPDDSFIYLMVEVNLDVRVILG